MGGNRLYNTSGGSPIALTGNTLWVDQVFGSDTDGVPGRQDRPYKTLTAAKNDALAGETIVVMPGTYTDTGIAKTGVFWSFMPGALAPEKSLVDVSAASDITAPKGFHPGANGLTRWKTSLGQVAKTAGGRGMGGIDVLLIGDSIVEVNNPGQGVGAVFTSGGLPDYLQSKWSQYLKVRLQKRLNPPGVQGGYGYIPASTLATYTGVPAGNSIFSRFGTGPGPTTGVSGKGLTFASGANGAYITLDPTTNPVEYRYNVTDIDFVGAQGPIIGTHRYDIKASGVGGSAMIGTGGVTGTIAGSGSLEWGHRWHITGVTRTVANTFQIASQASGSEFLYLDGILFYDNDYDCGVRVHNLGSWGRVAALTASTATGGTTENLNATITRFGSGSVGTGSGATQAKLVIFDWITNDVSTTDTPATPVATFSAQYASQIDAALALPSKPSVILMIPPIRSGLSTLAKTNYRTFRDAIYALAATRPDVSVLDLWEYANFEDHSGFVTTYGWNGDGTHYSDVAQLTWADMLYDILV